MQLKDLFEAIGELEPGEKKDLEGVKLRDLQAIETRIQDLTYAIGQSADLQRLFKTDHALQSQMNLLQDKIHRKINLLKKVQQRPTQGMQKLFDILDAECSEFIPQMQAADKLLLRGIRSDSDQFEGRSRQDRDPKDSRALISKTFDDMLQQLGVQALRRNSIFTTTSHGFASSYGDNVYIIFPKNGFSFLSTNERDLVLGNWTAMMDPDMLASLWRELDEWAQTHVPDWQNTGMHAAVQQEDWLWMSQLVEQHFKWNDNKFNLPSKYDLEDKQHLFVSPQIVEKNFQPNTENLVEPMRSGHEILINGEYWALRKRVWENAIRQRYLF